MASRTGTPQGWLNAGQKLNAIVTAAFAVLFAITGFFLWYGERDTRFRLANALLVHDWLMYVSFFLFVGHLYLSLIYPATRHALSGMTRGWVDEDWALQHHRKWVEGLREPPRRLKRPHARSCVSAGGSSGGHVPSAGGPP